MSATLGNIYVVSVFSCLSLSFSSASSSVSSSCSVSLDAKAANALAFLIVGRSIYFIMSINIMRH